MVGEGGNAPIVKDMDTPFENIHNFLVGAIQLQ